jgi:hypothetical protein
MLAVPWIVPDYWRDVVVPETPVRRAGNYAMHRVIRQLPEQFPAVANINFIQG